MATKRMIKKVLEQATSAQLIRVRAIISKNADENAMADLNPFAWKCNKALKAFDKARYGDPYIAEVLNDGALGEALR